MTDVHANESLKGCVIKVRIFVTSCFYAHLMYRSLELIQLTYFAEEKYLSSIEITYEMLQAKVASFNVSYGPST